MIMFIVYTTMLIKFKDDMWDVYDEYPEPVIYLISATGMYGFECVYQVLMGTIYNLDCGLKACKFSWIYIISCLVHSYWGVSHIFGERYDKMIKDDPNED